MFILEQILSPYLASRYSSSSPKYALASTLTPEHETNNSGSSRTRDLDLELEMELNAMGIDGQEETKNPNMMTLGLIIHSLADGLALGAANVVKEATLSARANTEIQKDIATPETAWWSFESTGLSFVVFIAIAVHKGKLLYYWSLTITKALLYSLFSSYCFGLNILVDASPSYKTSQTTFNRIFCCISHLCPCVLHCFNFYRWCKPCWKLDRDCADVLGMHKFFYIGEISLTKA